MIVLYLIIGFIFAAIVTYHYGGNYFTFVLIWGLVVVVFETIFSIIGLLLGVFAKWAIIILIIVLIISVINRLRGKAT